MALTDFNLQGRDLFFSWCREIGCCVEIDEMGNIFARKEGRNPNLPPVQAGSHLDTQPSGGKFDGVYGVLGALEVLTCAEKLPCQVAALAVETSPRTSAKTKNVDTNRRKNPIYMVFIPPR